LAKRARTTQLLTPTLIKAARALLGLSQEDLAANVDVSRKTVSYVEMMPAEKIDARRRDTLEKIRARLEEDYGVRFVFEEDGHGEGVLLRHPISSR
jgi:DNA-binding XRE family transcriptional regulator